jgi:hypothetical protein
VVVSNSVEIYAPPVSTALLTAFPTFDFTRYHHWIVFLNEDIVEFWVDDMMLFTVNLNATNVPVATSAMQHCIYARVYNSATNTGITQKLAISFTGVSFGDMEQAKAWNEKISSMGESSQCLPSGGVTGVSCTAYTQTAMPTVTTAISATALGTGQVAGLGGFQRFANAAGLSYTADTAWIIFSHLIPVPTVLTSKGLMIKGITINVQSRVAAGTNAAVVPFSMELSFGCTNLNPATAEAITTQTTPVKGTRKQILGFGSWAINTPIGTSQQTITWSFGTPVYCEAGTYVQILYRPGVTHVLANTQELVFAAGIDGYWE